MLFTYKKLYLPLTKKRMRKILILIIISLLFNSCIPTKDLTYFQGTPKEKANIHKIQQAPYRLQINDIIDIRIKAADETMVALFKTTETNANTSISENRLYFDSYSVDKNGFIRIPYLDEINVLGYTTKEVRLKIESELAKMFKNINDIFVSVKLAGIRYTVIGEVKSPGTNTLFQNQVNIIEAIANAGDITMTGNRKKITVIRNNINGIKKIQLDLTGVDFINSEGYFIQPNDIISVEPLKEKSWGTGDTGTKTISTVITSLSLITTTILLIKNL